MRRRTHYEMLKARVECSCCIFVACFILVGVWMARIQAGQYRQYRALADSRHVRKIPIEASPGIIRDRCGNALTQNLPVKSVFADPHFVRNPAATARRLASVLEMPADVIERRLRRPGAFAWLKRKVPRRTEKAVEALNLDGIRLQPETRRTYPLRTLAANLIGFVNIDGDGIEGLEAQHNEALRGRDGYLITEVDALKRAIPSALYRRTEPVNGYGLTLTLDTRIQNLTETAIEKAFTTYQAAGVCAVVLDVRTGAILAMATRPTYDPNSPADSKPEQRRNRCVTDMYEPGSTFKSFTVAGALEEKVITPQSVFACAGVRAVGRRRIRCVLHGPYKHGHGAQTIVGILRESCNIGAAQIAMRLGARKMYRYVANFGFLGDTRVGLIGEMRGLLDPPHTWVPIKLANVGFGQGVAVTPLQVVTAYAAIANGGVLMQPYLISRVEDSSGKTVQEYQPRAVRRVISAATARTVTECLKVVVEEGTGKPARIEGYSVAGKTGSAQKASATGRGYAPGKFVASFVGFAPADRPRVAAIVVVDEPKGSHWGATTAAPAFQEIVQGALWCLKVPPDRPSDWHRATPGKRNDA